MPSAISTIPLMTIILIGEIIVRQGVDWRLY